MSLIQLVLSAVALLVCIRSIHSLELKYNATALSTFTGSVPLPPHSTFLDTLAIPLSLHQQHVDVSPQPLPSIRSVRSLQAVTIDSLSGCVRDVNSSTVGCNLTSILTITGAGFAAPLILQIANAVNCSLRADAVRSSTLIVTPLCPYYYPSSATQLWPVRLFSNGSASTPLPAAISFANTFPVVASAASSTCNVPPYGGCDWHIENTFTISGHNFLLPPAPRAHFFFYLGGNQFLPCFRQPGGQTTERLTCQLIKFSWNGTAPPPSQFFPGLIIVYNANWLAEAVVSNTLGAAISFNEPPASSSSSTGGSGSGGGTTSTGPARYSTSTPALPLPPSISRVSGCEDTLNATRNCPYPWPQPLQLTIWGQRFRLQLPYIRIWVGEQPCTDVQWYNQRLLCHFNTSAVDYDRTGTAPLTLSLNSTAGWNNFSQAVSVNELATQIRPVIASVSGCLSSAQPAATAYCDRTMILTVYGDGFARYLPPSLVVDRHTIRCQFPEANPLAIVCPLQDADLSGVLRNVYVYVALQIGDRMSDPQPFVMFSVEGPVPPSPSSSGNGGGGATSDAGVNVDELVGMKLALLSMMIISLIVLVVALAVWVTGWWLAHRRSYVSQYGQAAVDSRQVLLQ